ncbi:MAG: ECF transporter S component [Firmicutes bacterium]|nr:ECF transporter S component [Bacillota bacterium]
MERKFNTKDITLTAVFAALVFLMTYTLKIPAPSGYTHLGDCMIFIAVLLLGTKRGALAGGIGAALADALGGYTHYILPTFFIKAIMAVIMGYFTYKVFKDKSRGWFIGAVIGGAAQVFLYTVIKIPMYDLAYALSRLPGNILQTGTGIAIAAVIIAVLDKGGIILRLRTAKFNV